MPQKTASTTTTNLLAQEMKTTESKYQQYIADSEGSENHAVVIGAYAKYLFEIKDDVPSALAQYQKMHSLFTTVNEPNIRALSTPVSTYPHLSGLCMYLSSYAQFLSETQQKYDLAEDIYQKVLSLDETHSLTVGNYAIFLHTIRKKYDQAEQFYAVATRAHPNHSSIDRKSVV